LLALDLSGSVRGEAGRLWLFLMPLLACAAAAALDWRPGAAALVVGSQLLMALAIALAWRPMTAVIVVAERPPMAAWAPEHGIDAPFSDFARLEGYSLEPKDARPGDALSLTLYWRARGPAPRPFTVFTHLVSDEGELIAQHDGWPAGGLWPPTCWRAGEEIIDRHTLSLPATLETGAYSLRVGLYDARDGSRLLTVDSEDSVELRRLEIAR
jgi:hypothetical protein